MVGFDEFCELCDLLADGEDAATRLRTQRWLRGFTRDMLLVCAAISDIESGDDAYFEALVKRSGPETLEKLLPYFSQDTHIGDIIRRRIRFMQTCEENRSENLPAEALPGGDFFSYLCEWIDSKGFKSEADFYNAAGISRQLFSKIRNNRIAITREMALHLAVALSLDYRECEAFLRFLGYSLNAGSRREQIISYIMRKRKYTFYEMEELLSAFGEKTFLDWD